MSDEVLPKILPLERKNRWAPHFQKYAAAVLAAINLTGPSSASAAPEGQIVVSSVGTTVNRLKLPKGLTINLDRYAARPWWTDCKQDVGSWCTYRGFYLQPRGVSDLRKGYGLLDSDTLESGHARRTPILLGKAALSFQKGSAQTKHSFKIPPGDYMLHAIGEGNYSVTLSGPELKGKQRISLGIDRNIGHPAYFDTRQTSSLVSTEAASAGYTTYPLEPDSRRIAHYNYALMAMRLVTNGSPEDRQSAGINTCIDTLNAPICESDEGNPYVHSNFDVDKSTTAGSLGPEVAYTTYQGRFGNGLHKDPIYYGKTLLAEPFATNAAAMFLAFQVRSR